MSSVVLIGKMERVTDNKDVANPLYAGDVLIYPSGGEPFSRVGRQAARRLLHDLSRRRIRGAVGDARSPSERPRGHQRAGVARAARRAGPHPADQPDPAGAARRQGPTSCACTSATVRRRRPGRRSSRSRTRSLAMRAGGVGCGRQRARRASRRCRAQAPGRAEPRQRADGSPETARWLALLRARPPSRRAISGSTSTIAGPRPSPPRSPAAAGGSNLFAGAVDAGQGAALRRALRRQRRPDRRAARRTPRRSASPGVLAEVDLLMLQATTLMRWGEEQNCVLGHNRDSCLLPIRGQGVHTRREGSTRAIGVARARAAARSRATCGRAGC